MFDKETVNDCLSVAGQLIDWNALDHFERIILMARQFLDASVSDPKFKVYRKSALRVVHSAVDKGMDHPNKI